MYTDLSEWHTTDDKKKINTQGTETNPFFT